MILHQRLITFILLLSLLVFTPVTVRAGEQFDLFIVPTIDEQLDSWLKIPSNLEPTIHLINRIYPNQPFALRLLFKGYSLSPLKNAHITYDVQFFDPDNKPTADKGNNLLGYNGPIKSANYIIINQQLLRVFFDNNYAFGDYGIQITATDQLSKKVISKAGTITFAPFKQSGQFASLDFFNFWLRDHFRQPDIAKATFGVLQFFEKDVQWLQKNSRLLAFMNQLLTDNPWAWDHLVRVYHDEPVFRNGIITLMAICNYQIPDLTAKYTPEQKAWFEKSRTFQPASTQAAITTPQQIESLWGIFYATGHLAPIEKIVRLLRPFALSEPTSGSTTSSGLEQVAFWSLVDHGTTTPLVANYGSYLLEHGKLAPENKIQLRLALQVIEKSLAELEEKEAAEKDKKNPLPLLK